MKVAIYIRVSTPKKVKNGAKLNEDDKFVQNPQVQLAPLIRMCEAREWKVVEVYQDRMTGSKQEERKGYQKLWKDARAGNFKTVVVWRYDRFARSTIELLNSLMEFGKLKIDFISLRENIDTSTAMGKMIFTFMAGLAEFERSMIIERVRAGMEYAKEHGTKSGNAIGRPKKIVRRDLIKQWALEGLSIRKIVDRMQGQEGVRVGKATVARIIAISKSPTPDEPEPFVFEDFGEGFVPAP